MGGGKYMRGDNLTVLYSLVRFLYWLPLPKIMYDNLTVLYSLVRFLYWPTTLGKMYDNLTVAMAYGGPPGASPRGRVSPLPGMARVATTRGSVPFAHLNHLNSRKNMGAFFSEKRLKNAQKNFY
mgnify:CR=1 FL=1